MNFNFSGGVNDLNVTSMSCN